MSPCCPIDKLQCRHGSCDEDVCVQLADGYGSNYTAEAREIGHGIALLGFWIGAGILGATLILLLALR